MASYRPAPTYNYTNITTATTTTIATPSSGGTLHSIVTNTPVAGTITVFDNTAASGNKIATINPTTAVNPGALIYDVDYLKGLTIVTSSAPDITVTWR